MDHKIEMMYETFSPDIEDILYEKTRFEHECQNNNFNILFVVREMVSNPENINFELMSRMYNRLKNGKILLWNCLKLACVVEYLSTNSILIVQVDIEAETVAFEEVDRELLIGKLWPKYLDMHDVFLNK